MVNGEVVRGSSVFLKLGIELGKAEACFLNLKERELRGTRAQF